MDQRVKPPDPKKGIFPMEWLQRGGKQDQVVPGRPEVTAENGKNARDNDATNGSNEARASDEKSGTNETDSLGEVRT